MYDTNERCHCLYLIAMSSSAKTSRCSLSSLEYLQLLSCTELLEIVTRLLTDCSSLYPQPDCRIAENLIVRLEAAVDSIGHLVVWLTCWTDMIKRMLREYHRMYLLQTHLRTRKPAIQIVVYMG